MYHQPSKRTQIIRRTISYGAMIVAILALVTILGFVIMGYQFNRKDGKIEQGGLVQFASQPGGADITIDNTLFGARTNAKTTLASGRHYISMARSHYQTWSKAVSVQPGEVLWLNYARLIPKDLTIDHVANFAALSSSIASPDQKWIAVTTDPSLPELQLADISQQQVAAPIKLALPATLYTAPSAGKAQQFRVVQWDKDSRYLLVKHTVDGLDHIEWLVVDTQAVNNSKNVSSIVNLPMTQVYFSPASSQALYVQVGTDVRKIDISAGTTSRPLVSNVEDFQLYRDNGIIFTTQIDPTTRQRSVGYVLDSDQAPRILHIVTDDGTSPLRLAIGEYFGDTYVALLDGASLTVRMGSLPKTAADYDAMRQITTQQLSMPATRVSIITNGRFVLAESPSQYTIYDLELHKPTTTILKGVTPDDPAPLHWIDGYMPVADRSGTLRLYEFDGANQHDIMPVDQGQAITLSQNGTYLYAFGKTDDGHYDLRRVRMILQ